MAVIAIATAMTYTQEAQSTASPNVSTGALFPEARYLEPTIGQIWPR